MDKRGISNIIATLLIVLLVIVVTSIVWVVVRNFVQESSEDISLTQFTTSVDIKSAAIEGGNMEVKVKRSVGKGTYLGTKFIFSDGKNSVVLEDRNNPLDELEERTFSFTPAQLTAAGIDILDITEVSVAPIIETEAGKEAIGQVTDTRKVGTGGTPTGGNCGDGIRQVPNEVGVNEVCDGADLNSNTCELEGFPDGGTLLCASDCLSFDTSQCTESTGGGCTLDATQDCPLQQGVCSGVQQTCIDDGAGGTIWGVCDYGVDYEVEEVTCDYVLDNDCDGLTDSDEDVCELTFTGTVLDPWPSLTKLFFIVDEATQEFIDPLVSVITSAMYIDFTVDGTLPTVEQRCLRIFEYIFPSDTPFFDKAIVQLEESVGPFDILSGDKFTIYEKTQCGT